MQNSQMVKRITDKLKTLIGYKEYLIKISLEGGGKDILRVRAWRPTTAMKKVISRRHTARTMEIVRPVRWAGVIYTREVTRSAVRKYK